MAITILITANGQSGGPAPLRVALAGLNHDHAVFFLGRKANTDISLVGIYEPDTVLVRRYSEKYHLRADLFYSDLGKMLDAVKPEAVFAFCSTNEHLAVVKACAPRGINVMVEKPLAVSMDQVRDMEQLVNKYHIYLLTDYETAWYPSTKKARQLILDSNYVGQMRKVIFHDGHQGPVAIHTSKEFLSWLTDPVENGGGALMDFGCYGANLITYLMQGQEPVSVTAVTGHFQPEVYPKVEDEATIIVSYPTTQCIIEASWNWPFGRKDMEVYGPYGYVKTLDNTTIRTRNESSVAEQTRQITPGEVDLITDPFSYFVAVVRGQIKMPAYSPYSLENNVMVIRILDAARQSASTGRTVMLKKTTGSNY